MNLIYSMIHLGCPKNLIDTEKILGKLADHNCMITANPEDSDVVLINTCGFIESARQEARENIQEMLQLKKQGVIKAVIVLGCFAQLYRDKLFQEFPTLDGVIGFCNYDNIISQIESILKKKQNLYIQKESFIPNDDLRLRITEQNYAYLRITEGCNNCCSYCTIPIIRGSMRSKSPETILNEAKMLIKDGVQELIVIGQDTGSYGIDIPNNPTKLYELIAKISELPNLHWIRIMYIHPGDFQEQFLKIFSLPHVIPYLEMPIQHINNRILKSMHRGNTTHESIEETIKILRNAIPNIILRTTVMVGFPGETEKEFQELYDFLQKAKFDRLGAFIYSAEENTIAAKLPNQIPAEVGQRRYDAIMQLQQKIAFENAKQKIGKKLEVVIEDQINKNQWRARSYGEAPEIDPCIYIQTPKKLTLGRFYNVQIKDSKDYDLIGKL